MTSLFCQHTISLFCHIRRKFGSIGLWSAICTKSTMTHHELFSEGRGQMSGSYKEQIGCRYPLVSLCVCHCVEGCPFPEGISAATIRDCARYNKFQPVLRISSYLQPLKDTLRSNYWMKSFEAVHQATYQHQQLRPLDWKDESKTRA